MKEITFENIASTLATLVDKTLRSVEDSTVALMQKALEVEDGENSRWALSSIIKNAEIAKRDNCFACQDCGLALVFVALGREVKLTCSLEEAINEGIRRGYKDARKSCAHPLTRKNTNDNTPAIIYTDIVEGDTIEISYLAKGAGSENMSKVYMLTPSKGREGIIESIVDCVKEAGANPCPPIIIGVGIGGTMDKAALLSKRALLRETGKNSIDPIVAALENDILQRVNQTGIGAQGLGGRTTALAVMVETFPTHIGMLPVAVTIQCHSVRHGKITL